MSDKQKRLDANVFTDMVGYRAVMQEDEQKVPGTS